MRTTFSKENKAFCNSRTDPAQFSAQSDSRKMRFPKTIKYRRFEAKIYGKSQNYSFYRVAYYTAGKRHVRNFKTFGEAKTEAEGILRDLARGSQSAGSALEQPANGQPIAANAACQLVKPQNPPHSSHSC